MMDFDLISSNDIDSQKYNIGGPVMVMPYIDETLALRCAKHACKRASASGLLLGVLDVERVGFIGVANQAFRATHGEWFGYMAQDAFAGRDWLAIALQSVHKLGAKFFGFNDGKWRGELASFGLASRQWAIKNYGGDFFFSGYNKHFADAELTLLARQDKCYAYDPNSVLVELDWDKDNSGVSAEDRTLFLKRQSGGFGSRVRDPHLLKLIS